ncbi:hypothetical protein STRDD10_01854 [Streptococcus sp. DD10]|uniref:DUF4649 family protein n=1 Tax=Streptococcus sp. DD10 TaxID=1777878 RepID=UPI0007984648|nr:DUF4649 family protein [Streptococcus sp. DD10]KXT72550.1 hypothetical protein STRDD10_01854 [Streptococcus sp. DD10]
MLLITYLDAAKIERHLEFASYSEFELSQQSCLIDPAPHYRVTKVTYNGHDLGYQGPYNDLFFYLLKQDLTQYN